MKVFLVVFALTVLSQGLNAANVQGGNTFGAGLGDNAFNNGVVSGKQQNAGVFGIATAQKQTIPAGQPSQPAPQQGFNNTNVQGANTFTGGLGSNAFNNGTVDGSQQNAGVFGAGIAQQTSIFPAAGPPPPPPPPPQPPIALP